MVDNSEYSLELPQSYERKKIVSGTPHIYLEDFAAADMPDNLEYVTHDSGNHGAFTARQRQDLIRHTLLDEAEKQTDAVILEKKGMHLQVRV